MSASGSPHSRRRAGLLCAALTAAQAAGISAQVRDCSQLKVDIPPGGHEAYKQLVFELDNVGGTDLSLNKLQLALTEHSNFTVFYRVRSPSHPGMNCGARSIDTAAPLGPSSSAS